MLWRLPYRDDERRYLHGCTSTYRVFGCRHSCYQWLLNFMWPSSLTYRMLCCCSSSHAAAVPGTWEQQSPSRLVPGNETHDSQQAQQGQFHWARCDQAQHGCCCLVCLFVELSAGGNHLSAEMIFRSACCNSQCPKHPKALNTVC